MEFARVKQGPFAGELVRIPVNPSINLIRENKHPHNPYKSGYGKRIPTNIKVRVFDQRWRRVYVACFSNAGTTYVEYKGERVILEILSGY